MHEGRPVDRPHEAPPVVGTPHAGVPVRAPQPRLRVPRLREHLGAPIRVPHLAELRPLQPPPPQPIPILYPPGSPYFFVPIDALPCGPGSDALLPTLVLVERCTSFGASDSTDVIYSIAPGIARIDYAGGRILLDEPAQRVAFYDAERETWDIQPLGAWEGHVDSIRAWTREHMQSAGSTYQRFGPSAEILGYASRPYRLAFTVDTADGARDEITSQVWVTESVEATPEIYATYRRTLELLDNQWLDVPVERPAGVLLRTREARISTPRAAGEGAHIEEATMVQIGYRLYPRDFFGTMGEAGMAPTSSSAYEP